MRGHRNLVRAWIKPLPVSLVVVGVLLVVPLFLDERGTAIAAILLGSVVGPWASIAVHELGHLVIGKWVDFRFVLYIAGPLAVQRTPKGIRVSGNERWLLPGLTVMMPERLHSLRRRFLWTIAGGPLANLLELGLMGIPLWIVVSSGNDEGAWQEAVFGHSSFRLWAAIFCAMAIVQGGIVCLMLIIAGLWPWRAKKTGLMSDGGRIRMLLRGGADADRWVALVMLMNTSMAGRRPREWDTRWIQPATALSDHTVDEWQACLWAYMWALDREDVDLAGEYLDRLEPLGENLPLVRPLVAAEVAFFEARHRGNLVRARERLASASPETNEPRFRAEAAVHLRERRWAEAQESGAAALNALAESSTLIEAGMDVAKVEWIQSLLAEAERGAT